MFLTLLPFLSGGFVLISTLPAGLRQFAEYQPFTPVIQTIRGLLTGGPIGAHAIAAVAWSAGLLPVVDPPLRPAPGSRPEIADTAPRDRRTSDPRHLTRIPGRCPGPGAMMPAANHIDRPGWAQGKRNSGPGPVSALCPRRHRRRSQRPPGQVG